MGLTRIARLDRQMVEAYRNEPHALILMVAEARRLAEALPGTDRDGEDP